MPSRLVISLLAALLGCGQEQNQQKNPKKDAFTPQGDGLGFVTPEVGSEPDVAPPDEDVAPPEDLPPAPSSLTVFVNDELYSGDTVDLPALLPGPTAQALIKLQLANFGAEDLTVTAVGLEATNQDGTPKNAWVALEYGVFDPAVGFPVVLHPHDVDLTSILQLTIAYKPESFDANVATMLITSTDPTVPTHRIRFVPAPIAPKVRIEPPSATFSTATLTTAEEKTFEIHNDGLAALQITKVELVPPTGTGYSLVSPPELAHVQPKGAPGYAPIAFTVHYQPTFGASKETASVVVTTNDVPATVALSATYDTPPGASPCQFQWEGQDKGFLDFTDTPVGSKTIAVTLKNLGTNVCTLSYVAVPEDPTKAAYDVAITIPGDPPIVVGSLPTAVGAGKEIRMDVTYTAGLQSLDATLVIDYQDPFPKQMTIPAHGGGPKPCFEMAPGSADAPMSLQLVAPPGNDFNRTFMVYSCGDAPLSILDVTLEDVGKEGAPSAVFSLVQPAPSLTIPPGGVQPYMVKMNSPETAATLPGKLTLTYAGLTGPKTVVIPLNGIALAGISLPVANAGSSGDYPGAVAGQQILLDGSKSAPGADFIAENGYIWFLVSRPPDSQKILNGPAGPAQRSFVPDVPGAYTFALVVKTQGTVPYYSQEAIVTVYVEAAP